MFSFANAAETFDEDQIITSRCPFRDFSTFSK